VWWREESTKEEVREVRGLIVAWNRPCTLRLAVLFACRYVDDPAAAAAAAVSELEMAFPVPAADDRRECWLCDDGSRSRSGLGARDCTRDGTWLALRLADLLDGAVSGGLAMIGGDGAFCDSERSSSELTYSRSPWPMGGET
jgi:hypothetical protein